VAALCAETLLLEVSLCERFLKCKKPPYSHDV
jgi:hypothetical protein